MKILCLFLRYGTRQYSEAFPSLQRWYRSALPDVTCDFWIIDNALPSQVALAGEPEPATVVPGDNRFGEFTGWEHFLREQKALIDDYDLIHFVTSAYQQHYTRYLGQVTLPALELAAASEVCLGHVDYYEQPVRIGTEFSDHWIRTCFFFLSPRAARRVLQWVRCTDPASIFDDDGALRPDSFIDRHYQERIDSWLTGQPHQGVSYHSPRVDRQEFIRKALAIVNEHGFSITLREAGVRLVDFGFSYIACASAYPAHLLTTTPVHRQLELRYDYLTAFPEDEWGRPETEVPRAWEHQPAFYRWNTLLEIGAGRPHNVHLGPGWSTPEVGGCWTEGHRTTLRFLVEPVANPVQISLLMRGFQTGSVPRQTVHVSCGNQRVATLMVGGEATFLVTVPYERHLGLRPLIIHFDLPGATSPRAIGMGADDRLLGVSLRMTRLMPSCWPSESESPPGFPACKKSLGSL